MDVNDDVNDQHWTLCDHSLNDTKHALYYTLQQMYKGYKSKVSNKDYTCVFPMNQLSLKVYKYL